MLKRTGEVGSEAGSQWRGKAQGQGWSTGTLQGAQPTEHAEHEAGRAPLRALEKLTVPISSAQQTDV